MLEALRSRIVAFGVFRMIPIVLESPRLAANATAASTASS
jgi:hypothetical protein